MEPEGALESEGSEKSVFSSQQDYEEFQEADETGPENPLLQPALTGDVEGLQKIFEDPEHPHHEHAVQLLLEEDIVGRNLLYAACMAGKSDVVRALAKYGVNLNEKTARGYTLLHCAAAWGRLETLKALVELDVDIDTLNFRGEKARDVAARYSQTECVHFLDWADARLVLKKFITKSSLIITDPEKGPGKLLKEDKNTILNACRMKNEWLETHPEASISELFEQKQQLEEIMTPILTKMSTPPKDDNKPDLLCGRPADYFVVQKHFTIIISAIIVLGGFSKMILKNSEVFALMILSVSGFVTGQLAYHFVEVHQIVYPLLKTPSFSLYCYFLPLIVFVAALDVDFYIVKNVLWQVLLTGVISFGITFVTIAYVVLKFNEDSWDLQCCLLFTITLCIIDPLHSVNSLKTIGISKMYTDIIRGESLIICSFTCIFFGIFRGHTTNVSMFRELHVIIGLSFDIFGSAICGYWCTRFIRIILTDLFSNTLTNVVLCFSLVYMTFYLVEYFGMSGIVALVTVGLNLDSLSFKPRMEFIITKLLTVLFVSPILMHSSYEYDWRWGVVIAWSGIRGVFSLLLAPDIYSFSEHKIEAPHMIIIPILINIADVQIKKSLSLMYSITKGYVKSQEDAKLLVRQISGRESIYQKLYDILEKNKREAIKELGLLEHEGRDVVIALKTKQAIRHVIAKALKNLTFLWSRGIIDKHEGIEMNKVLLTKIKALNNFPMAIPPPTPDKYLPNIVWMENKDVLIEFFKERTRLTYFDYGDIICREGEMPQGIFLIISGMASLHSSSPTFGLDSNRGTDRQFKTMYTEYCTSGDVLGELSCLLKREIEYTAICETTLQAFFISLEDLYEGFDVFWPSLEYKIWLKLALGVANQYFEQVIAGEDLKFQKCVVSNYAYVETLSSYNEVTLNHVAMKIVILVYGNVINSKTEESHVAPSIIPKSCDQIQGISDVSKLLIILASEPVKNDAATPAMVSGDLRTTKKDYNWKRKDELRVLFLDQNCHMATCLLPRDELEPPLATLTCQA
ncbi:Sodium/hydrogen exchanger 11 [Microtus ochrogaster]|uniref:Sodium/hydrogen exchanger 11 n=1 Tax=Microtus ochrogaster TaxID=79684 RepID=A0A8J6KQL3_MICOH|nr:Sodium/hydrogen exchanger 11 [Microtus ochrogaster]